MPFRNSLNNTNKDYTTDCFNAIGFFVVPLGTNKPPAMPGE